MHFALRRHSPYWKQEQEPDRPPPTPRGARLPPAMEELEEIYFRVHVQMVQWVQRALSAKVGASLGLDWLVAEAASEQSLTPGSYRTCLFAAGAGRTASDWSRPCSC
jgi:hypothetical protein